MATTLAGLYTGFDRGWVPTDGTGRAARFGNPTSVSIGGIDLAVDGAGNVYVADSGNSTIRRGVPASSIPAPMLMAPILSAGQFGFGISGLPGLVVDIESSIDLSHWQVTGTYILERGSSLFVSPTPLQGVQFYRGHLR